MLAPNPSWDNAIAAMLPSPFVDDLAKVVTNDGADDGVYRYLLTLAVDFLRANGQPHTPINAFDFASFDFEAIGRCWPIMGQAALLVGAEAGVTASIARFIAERLPAIWAREPWQRHPAVTRALVLADRTHDLVSLFSIGLKPTGSKDPFALRRAANHWLMQVVSPHTVGWR